jgi:mannonate dehydratase
MDRREFITTSGAGAAAAAAGVLGSGSLGSTALEAQTQRPAGAARKPLLLQIGSNANAYDENDLIRIQRFGVKSIIAGIQIADPQRMKATPEEFARLRALPDKHGIKIGVMTSYVPVTGILKGQSPERDREIEAWQNMIKGAAAAGLPCVKYLMSILGNVRTGRDPGRADTSHSSSDLKLVKEQSDRLGPIPEYGVVTRDMYWERLTYFLDRVVPVANEYKVRIANHPNDSIVPDEGYRGVFPVLSTPDGLKRYVTIRESPYHGLNLCLGVLSEMMENPKEDIFEPLQWLSSRKKVFNIHFRNIKGNRNHYAEVAPDEGEADFTRAVLVLAQNGYDGHITPDHNVQAAGDNTGGQAYWAFVYGYIAASIKAAERQMNS